MTCETYKVGGIAYSATMARTFTFVIRGDASIKLEQIKSRAADSGVFFNGDVSSGTFVGDMSVLGLGIQGTYELTRKNIVLTVTKKPGIYPWDLVEARLRSFVGD